MAALAATVGVPEGEVWALAWGLACIGFVSLLRLGEGSEVGLQRGGRETVDLQIDVDRVINRHRAIREGDYFGCLGVEPEASLEEISQAHLASRQQFDPANLHAEVVARFAAELVEIREVLDEALEVLGDEELLGSYRASLLAARGEAS